MAQSQSYLKNDFYTERFIFRAAIEGVSKDKKQCDGGENGKPDEK